MNHAPEEQHLVALMLGHQVVIEYIAGISVDNENVQRLLSGEVLKGQPEARTRVAYLQRYSRLGVEVSVDPEGEGQMFIPWAAVLAIYGKSRQELLRIAREDMVREQGEQSEEGGTA